MTGRIEQPDYEAVLRPLKGFQRRTVDYAFQQLYQIPNGTGRFLVADEVGLGKTLVARGVVARAVEHLWDSTARIDIIYICSNADIARQNIARLTIPGLNHFTPADRITLLPISTRQRNGRNFKDEKVNFIPLTPGTSFKMFSHFGTIWERALLYRMLTDAVEMPMDGAMHVFSGDASKKRFRYEYLSNFDAWYRIDPTLKASFLEAFEKETKLRCELVDVCHLFQQSRKEIRRENRWQHLMLVNNLRRLLANTCMDALEPDLVIMDEFQRFKHLLRDDNAAGELATALFRFPDVRVLLLSATPYKMYTLHDEVDGENHHGDFLETLKFLFDDESVGNDFRQLLRTYRQALLQYGSQESSQRNTEALQAAKTAVESKLRQVMSRTEKVAASADRNGMFRDMNNGHHQLRPQDLSAYVSLQHVSGLLKHHNTMEYWKSAPYLLNFMEDYKFKRNFQYALTVADKANQLAQVLAQTPEMLLSRVDMEQYERVDAGNMRLRQLMTDTVDSGAWQLLWIPPSLPYYRLERPFDGQEAGQFTKRLVFSAWHVVPKVVASLLSYEAERNMMKLFDETAVNTAKQRENLRGRLEIARSSERLTGMPVLGIMYPSAVLAELGDPLTYAVRQSEDAPLELTTVLQMVQTEIDNRLSRMPVSQKSEGAADEAWYWAAPILLDNQANPNATSTWWQTGNLAAIWAGGENAEEDSSAWADHVAYAQNLIAQPDPFQTLGRPPENLSAILAQIAVGGLGNVGLRALSRLSDTERPFNDHQRCLNAASIAWSFRSLFNVPEVIALIRGLYKDESLSYWQQVITYSAAGCLQAVMDEYGHVLRESVGLADSDPGEVEMAVTQAMCTAIQLRTASLKVDEIRISKENSSAKPESFRLRSHFAQRFGDIHSDTDKTLARKGAVREAFNSPFWPFVLVTTSVGQEGLDFHQYCHAIVHWNLPTNPVDLEQREGRVHRYKGHAIRKNVAHDYGRAITLKDTRDPWQEIFNAANGRNQSDLVPYWIYPENGAAQAYIQRYVPVLPLSRDAHRLLALRKALTVYRMVFGQNRQEDLVAYLLNRLSQKEIDRLMSQLQIDLQPPQD